MPKGRIIYLNGVSSAGKTSIAGALEAFFPDSFCVPVDAFFDMPTSQMWKENPSKGFLVAFETMHHAAAHLAGRGETVIIDTVALLHSRDKEFLDSMRWLAPFSGLLVQVVCPVDELCRREMARGDRQIGQAQGQLPLLPPAALYDITVDSHAMPPDECAKRIWARAGEMGAHQPFQQSLRTLEALAFL